MRRVVLGLALAALELGAFNDRVAAQRWAPYIDVRAEAIARLETAALPARGAHSLLPEAPDYRYEGAAIGGLLFGVSLAVVGHAVCENSDSSSKNCTWGAVKVGVLGLATGAIAGALIGGMFPKHQAPQGPAGP